MTNTTTFMRQTITALLALLAFTLVLGVGYPLAVWGVGRVVAPAKAAGSYLTNSAGVVVGSSLIGQNFTGPTWFHGRPSVAGSDGYDAMSSAASNLAADNPDLLALVAERRAAVAAENGVDPAAVPADALLASGSGLDPHISPEYASLQVARVAKARGLGVGQVQALVDRATEGRPLGYLGQPKVNVLELNLALTSVTG